MLGVERLCWIKCLDLTDVMCYNLYKLSARLWNITDRGDPEGMEQAGSPLGRIVLMQGMFCAEFSMNLFQKK